MYDKDQEHIGNISNKCIITRRANNFAKICKQNHQKYEQSCKMYQEFTDKLYLSILQITDSLPLDIKFILVNKIKLL